VAFESNAKIKMWLTTRRKEKAERKVWHVDNLMAETPQARADLSRDQSTMIGTATTARKIISGFSGLWHESCSGGQCYARILPAALVKVWLSGALDTT
jgi:hypothetical protein